MSDVTVERIRERMPVTPTRSSSKDKILLGLMYLFLFLLMFMGAIPWVTQQRPNDGHSAIVMLGSAWSILIVGHLRQQNRISTLEQRITELESQRPNSQ